MSPDTETVHCPDAGLCGGECPLHEPEEVTEARELARVTATQRLIAAERELAALQADPNTTHRDRVLAALAGHDVEEATLAADDVPPTIDAWTERVALAARRTAEAMTDTFHATVGPGGPSPVIVVNPDDEAAMRAAHSASPTDGPILLWGLRVVADEHVPARTARLRYDVDVPL